MPRRFSIKVNTTFTETKRAGLGAKYLNLGEIDIRAGIEIAISCVFAPLGAAVNGASRQEIESLSIISRTQLENYLNLALNRCGEREKTSSQALDANAATDEFDQEEDINLEEEDE